jgi:hypothetical protein
MATQDESTPQNGRWAKGISGNPGGRPPGSRNKATLAMESLLDGAGEKLINKALERALDGDMTAIKLCLERILPVRRDRYIQLDIPTVETADQIPAALDCIFRAVADGQITPVEGELVSGLLMKKLQAIDQRQLEMRLAKLEAKEAEPLIPE